ncbi:MAG: O-antigen ligase family protein [Saprospiraceae bacterium]
MLNYIQQKVNLQQSTTVLFIGLVLTIVCSIIIGIITEEYILFGLPALYLGLYIAIVDFRKIFYLLLASIPLSTELELPGGFSTDFPGELLLIGLMGLYGLYFLRNGQQLGSHFFKHPITILLLVHIGWIGLTVLHAGDQIIALKFFLAKIWYVVSCYFMAGLLLKTEKDIQTFFKWVFIPLFFTVLIIMIRHALMDFSFDSINFVLNPFYRNHVSYAAILVVFFPFLWYAPTWVNKYSKKWWLLIGSILFFLIAIYFTYTRAAYVSLVIAAGTYIIIKLRLMKVALASTLIIAVIGLNFVAQHNKYLDFAPDFNKAIAHKKFDNLLDATAKGEDISTMERVYRWVAGGYMVQEKPWFGFGPGNFYTYYPQYTVSSFSTYVSDNPEKSGIHCYYLMVAVEQGIIGLIIFLLLCFTVLLKGEQLYHQVASASNRRLVLMITLSLVIILSLLLINDLVETDKVGTFFFMGMAMLVNLDERATP